MIDENLTSAFSNVGVQAEFDTFYDAKLRDFPEFLEIRDSLKRMMLRSEFRVSMLGIQE